jgi:hypothetical protein
MMDAGRIHRGVDIAVNIGGYRVVGEEHGGTQKHYRRI